MMNSELMAQTAEAVARTLTRDAMAGDSQPIEQAWLSVLIRPPSDADVRDALEYIRGFEKLTSVPDARARAWKSYCRILLASNDFIYLN
jgi:chemotaxis regulatin CheY-phosphate phosphatase CheZ